MLDGRVDIYFCYTLMEKTLNAKARIPTRPTNYRELFSFYKYTTNVRMQISKTDFEYLIPFKTAKLKLKWLTYHM